MCSGGYGWATGQWQGGDYLSEWRSYFPWASGFGSDRPADQPLLMFCLNSSHRYHLYRGVCDMRKSFNGLSGLVRNELNRDPASGEVFVFLNRRRTLMKLLHWEAGGFVLYYQRLEKGTVTPPVMGPGQSVVRWPQLVLMIEGITVESARQKLRYRRKKRCLFYLKTTLEVGIIKGFVYIYRMNSPLENLSKQQLIDLLKKKEKAIRTSEKPADRRLRKEEEKMGQAEQQSLRYGRKIDYHQRQIASLQRMR